MATGSSTTLIPEVTSRDHVRGPACATITLVIYGSYACPHCKELRFVVDRLHATLGDELRYVFRNFPKPITHPNSEGAAEAAEASGVQNKFWEMQNILYDHQIALSDKHLRYYATQIGLDLERFNREMMLHTHAFRVHEDILSARQSGVGVTPALFINNSRHLGPFDFNTLLIHIELALSKLPSLYYPIAIGWQAEATKLLQSSSSSAIDDPSTAQADNQ